MQFFIMFSLWFLNLLHVTFSYFFTKISGWTENTWCAEQNSSSPREFSPTFMLVSQNTHSWPSWQPLYPPSISSWQQQKVWWRSCCSFLVRLLNRCRRLMETYFKLVLFIPLWTEIIFSLPHVFLSRSRGNREDGDNSRICHWSQYCSTNWVLSFFFFTKTMTQEAPLHCPLQTPALILWSYHCTHCTKTFR